MNASKPRQTPGRDHTSFGPVRNAWLDLQDALRRHRPACLADPRFTDDSHPAELAAICRTCPVRRECSDYADLAKPTGGTWAGKQWAVYGREPKPVNRPRT